MVGSVPPLGDSIPPPAPGPTGSLPVPPAPLPVPPPRRAPTPGALLRAWYENELGWPTVPGTPVLLSTGLRFDALEVPAEAGHAALGRLRPASPVALRGDRMLLLVAAGSAEELPGILEWLEWGVLPLDLTAIGAGGAIEAPRLPGRDGAGAVQGAAVWLRPPVKGREAEASLPTMSALGGGGDAPDLVRLVDTVATECHRARLRRGCAQPIAFS
ncbi:SCO3374 family protein [Streptomyces sp. bgisy154]|uniref:SCO3374 family protein n=1 Tax=Streptomyces sp. bgisy154 TaxID=3413794 RepID=UPI003D72067F